LIMVSNRKIVLIILLVMALSATTYFMLVVIPAKIARQTYDGAKQIGKDVASVFQLTPEVIVNNTIILQQKSPVLELATIKQQFQHQYSWMNTWAGSTKKINISGVFESKAGFDLNKRFSIAIHDEHATVLLPAPQVLSVELVGDVKFSDEHGIWNWVNQQDRANAIEAFQRDARTYAQQGEFVQMAKNNAKEKLTAILKAHGKTAEIVFDDSAKVIAPER